jgi:hypothetical protein
VLYAELDEYSPLDEDIQIIASSWADRLTSLSHCHMFTKMLISSVEVIRCNPLSHFLSCKLSATDIFFLQASLYRLGTILLGHSPSSHLSCQKLTFLPLPRLIIVQALNKLTSVFSVPDVHVCSWLVWIIPFVPLPSQTQGDVKL